MSEATTRGVRVRVEPFYLPSQSDPEAARWVFGYRVHIQNFGPATVQLQSRHWIITDGNGRVEEVQGPGVVGEQPLLTPGQGFTYVSGCPLPTPVGAMHGAYQMITADGERFEATIAPFTLAAPGALH
jgi:ApaG protein